MILLDEATASVDADNEFYIQQAVSELCRDKTVLVIAHRLNTIRGADLILVLDKGRIVEQGSHSELIQKGGIYSQMAGLQEKMSSWSREARLFGWCQGDGSSDTTSCIPFSMGIKLRDS